MRVHVYTFCLNEERLVPFFLRHYHSGWVERIVVHDNESTDRSVELLTADPRVEVRVFHTPNQDDKKTLNPIRNRVWRESQGVADFVVMVDFDEFLYHYDMPGFLGRVKERQYPVCRAYGWNMVCERFPADDGKTPLTQLVRRGYNHYEYSKPCLIQPDLLLEPGWWPGAHNASPRMPNGLPARVENFGSLMLLHYKRLGWEYFWAMQQARLKRCGFEFDPDARTQIHYAEPMEKQRHDFEIMLRDAVDLTT